MSKFYITTAIAYANASPHIGFALELLYADVLARYHRLRGSDVYFLTGTDEHGQKIWRAAQALSLPPKKFTDQVSAKVQFLADRLNITNDDFIRTTETRHKKAAVHFWKAVKDAGYIYKKKYSGLYCVGCEAFITDKELVEGKCPNHNLLPEKISEENYFFKLSAFNKQLLAFFKKNPKFVIPRDKYNEMLAILKSGLEDTSISRSRKHLPWGIPVPGDKSQVMYVWFDALTNYISALGYGSKPSSPFRKYWPADVHIIGKEINRFHSLLWPAMLLAAKLPLPAQIAVHGWMTNEGQKMSKTLGNVVNPMELIDKYGSETVRYYLMREMAFGNDGDFSLRRLEERYTADLANGLGNLVARVLTMTEKYFDGRVPLPKRGRATPTWRSYELNMNELRFADALKDVWDLISWCDRFINEEAPWQLAKIDRHRLNHVLYTLLEALRHIALMLWPFMPETAEKILKSLGVLEKSKKLGYNKLKEWGLLKPRTRVKRGENLFPKLV